MVRIVELLGEGKVVEGYGGKDRDGGGEDIRKKVQRVGIETLCSSAEFVFAVELVEL